MNYPFQCPVCGHKHNMPKTNADRIRAMTDEELAEFVSNCGCPDHARNCRRLCEDCVLEWLKESAEVDDNA